MKKLITFVGMFLFLGCFFFQWYAKESFAFFWRVLHLSAQECHTWYFIYFIVYLSFSCFTFNRYWLTEKLSLRFFFGFHFLHHSAQEFSYFIFFYSLFKASPVLLLTGQVLKIPVWFAENFPFFLFLGLPKKWNILFELDFLQPFDFQICQCELNLFFASFS